MAGSGVSAKFDTLQIDSAIREQAPFDAVKEIEMEYSIASDESEEDNTYLSYNKVIGTKSLTANCIWHFRFWTMHFYLHRAHRLRRRLWMPVSEKNIMGSYDNRNFSADFLDYCEKCKFGAKKEEFLSIVEQNIVRDSEKGNGYEGAGSRYQLS